MLASAAAQGPSAPEDEGGLVCANEGSQSLAQTSLPPGTMRISGTVRRTAAREGEFRLQLLLTDDLVSSYAGIYSDAGPLPTRGPRISRHSITRIGRHGRGEDFEPGRTTDGGQAYLIPPVDAFSFVIGFERDDAIRIDMAWQDNGRPSNMSSTVALRGMRPAIMILYCALDDFVIEDLRFEGAAQPRNGG